MITAIGVFLASAFIDFAWAHYTMAVSAKRVHPAAAWSVVIGLLGAVSVLSYTHNKWLLIPIALGYYAGTWFAVRRELKK